MLAVYSVLRDIQWYLEEKLLLNHTNKKKVISSSMFLEQPVMTGNSLKLDW